MYSLILMAAVAAGPETTAFGGKWRSCYGCYGGCYSACYGCYGGCYSACHGCCGGYYTSCHGCFGGFFHKHKARCFGCFGGCYSACFGCYGSCYGYAACYGCYGSCYGCTGCFGIPYVGGIVIDPAPIPPAQPVPPAQPTPAEPAKPETKTSYFPSIPGTENPRGTSAAAHLSLELPADAILYVDGQKIPGTGTLRKFHTPELPLGKAFFYELRAEILLDGKLEVEEARIIVRAGDQLNRSFSKLIAAANASKDPVVTASR